MNLKLPKKTTDLLENTEAMAKILADELKMKLPSLLEVGLKLKPRTLKEQLAYLDGYAAATRDYAIWKDGEQTIGVMRTPLKKAIELLEMHKETARAMKTNPDAEGKPWETE